MNELMLPRPFPVTAKGRLAANAINIIQPQFREKLQRFSNVHPVLLKK